MEKRRIEYHQILSRCEELVKELGIHIKYVHNLDPFFKGDLDGKTIYIGFNLPAEDKIFNLLHLAGHTVQWNVSKFLRHLGSKLYSHPSDTLLKRLQTYEWEANCYCLTLLHKADGHELDKWLRQKYVTDMMYLTHYYKTGQKLKRVTAIAKAYPFKRELKPKHIPKFTPVASPRTRNGIVISFN